MEGLVGVDHQHHDWHLYSLRLFCSSFVFGLHTRLHRAPYVQLPFMSSNLRICLWMPVSTWNGACGGVLWIQVPSEERTPSRLGLAFLLANGAEGALSFSSHCIAFLLWLWWNWFFLFGLVVSPFPPSLYRRAFLYECPRPSNNHVCFNNPISISSYEYEFP